MSPERFLEQFGYLADAPNGIVKLRELILQLAVRGKLVPQDQRSSPVDPLKIPRRFTLGASNIDLEAVPFSLPEGWTWAPLLALGDWANGCGFPKSIQGHTDKPHLFCKVSDMNLEGNDKFIRNTNNTIDDGLAAKWKIKLHPAGTIIFPKIGGAISTNKRRVLTRPTAIDNNCLGITPGTDCSTDWLFLLLRSLDLAKYQSGTSVPALSQGVIGRIVTGLPPLAEQSRIVAKVDQLMALCDELETKQTQRADTHIHLIRAAHHSLTQPCDHNEFQSAWQRIRDNFDQLHTTLDSVKTLRQTILQLAVRGKLVPQDPNDEPASVLLEKIRAEKERLVAEGKIKKKKSLPRIEPGDVPLELPRGWEWVRVGSVLNVTSGMTFDKGLEKVDGVIPYVKVGNMSMPGNELVITTSSRFIDPDGRMEDWIIPAGSIIFPKRGGAIATNKKRIVKDPIFVDLNTMALTPTKGGVDTAYVYQWLSSVDLATLNTGTSVPQINHKDIEPLPFPLPPRAEQHRIVAKVDQLIALCDDLEAKINANESASRHFAEAVVAELAA